MAASLLAAQDGTRGRFYCNDMCIGEGLLDGLAGATHGTAGADACHESIYGLLGCKKICHYLGTGGVDMSLRICGIVKLLQYDSARDGVAQLLSLPDSTSHPFAARCQDDFRAIGRSKFPALDAHGLRHGKDNTIATYRTHERQSDTGVAGSRFDDSATRFEDAALLRVVNHGQCHTVFDAAAGIEEFYLGDDVCLCIMLFSIF